MCVRYCFICSLDNCYASLDSDKNKMDENKQCKFPFTYKKHNVTKCIKNDWEFDGNGYVCPISNPDTNWRENKTYGYCQKSGCKNMDGK